MLLGKQPLPKGSQSWTLLTFPIYTLLMKESRRSEVVDAWFMLI